MLIYINISSSMTVALTIFFSYFALLLYDILKCNFLEIIIQFFTHDPTNQSIITIQCTVPSYSQFYTDIINSAVFNTPVPFLKKYPTI